MTKTELTPAALNAIIQGNPGVFFEGFTKIKGTNGKLIAPRMNVLQRRVNAFFMARRAKGMACRGIGLKPRKRGFSTIVGAIHYTELAKHSFEACIVGNKLETSDTVFRMMRGYYEHDAVAKNGDWSSGAKWTTEKAVWSHGSILSQSTAMNGESIRGQTPQCLHGCVPPGTQVIVGDGWTRNIEDVREGDDVLTHTGAKAKVIAVIGQENRKGAMIRIAPWLGDAICFTEEHKIPTRRGIVMAKDVTEDDELCLPVRPITQHIRRATLPAISPRRQGGGKLSTGAGVSVKLTEDFGFACGYYLAEGCVSGRGDYISAVTFTRHKFEADYAEKACRAIRLFTSSRRTDFRKGTETAIEVCYGAAISQWFAAEFGRLDEKRIPDWVFSAGDQFCLGLLAGLLCGDGSKGREATGGYEIARMVLPTTRSSIAMQSRDIAASLGFGWASIRSKEAGQHYGRNCKKCWRVVWTGEAARKLRALIGAPEVTGGRKRTEKYRIEDSAVWIKIRKIERGIEVPYMWDLSIGHDDHTFRTPSFAIGNTEVAHWNNDEEVLLALLNAVPDDPNTSIFLESTPNGIGNAFAKRWDEARWPTSDECPDGKPYWKYWEVDCPDNPDSVLSDFEFVRIFAAWFEFEESTTPLTIEQRDHIKATLDERSWYAGERELIAKYGNIRLPDCNQRLGVEIEKGNVWEQLAWRRSIIKNKCGSDPKKFDQEYPADPKSCFLASGNPVFDGDAIADYVSGARGQSPQYGTLDLNKDDRVAWRPCENDMAIFWRWEEPKKGCRYLIVVDSAEGSDQTKGEDPDCHSVIVLRCAYKDSAGVLWRPRVVARVAPPCRVPMHAVVAYVKRLHLHYGRAIVIPEMNNSGLAFIIGAQHENITIWKRQEFNPRTGKEEERFGWRTTDSSDYGGVRTLIIDNLGRVLRERDLHCVCPHIIHELGVFVDKDGKKQAARGEHDDDVLALAIGLYNLDAASLYEEPIVQRQLPRDLQGLEDHGGGGNMIAMST